MRTVTVACTLILAQAILVAAGKNPTELPSRLYFVGILLLVVGFIVDVIEFIHKR